MSDRLFAAFDIGLAIWQLVVLKRGLRRDRSAAEAAKAKNRAGTP